MAIMHYSLTGKSGEVKNVVVQCQNKKPVRADKENAVKVIKSRHKDFKIMKTNFKGYDRHKKNGTVVDINLQDIDWKKPGFPNKEKSVAA
jgi:hypothetical protein